MIQQTIGEEELDQLIKSSEKDIEVITNAVLDDFELFKKEKGFDGTFLDYYNNITNFTQLMRASLTPSGVKTAGQTTKILVDFSSAAQLQMNSFCDQYKEDVVFSVLVGITVFAGLAIALGIIILRFLFTF